MMPAFCPSDAPPGEKAVYAALRDSDETDEWSVLHSLGIADHIRQVEGEADFVVVVPNKGILVIEVKSHLEIDRRPDGTWKLGNDAPTARGPFQQASEAMHSLRPYLAKDVDLRSIPMLSAVWFTGVRARTMLPASPEWHDWQVLDVGDLDSVRGAILRTLTAGIAHLDDKIKYFSYGGIGPDHETAQRIVSLLRPKFELAMTSGDRRRARESQLAAFVEEQFFALDAASDNQSVLFTGPAGSGKTFLAMESARREIVTGKRGRLLCFNRFLSQQLVRDLADLDGLTVSTFHQELLSLAKVDRVPQDAGPGFWNEQLPEMALESLIYGGATPSDFLIIDEIQDICSDPYLDVLDLMVKGGLKEGRVLLFGDFERQSIFNSELGLKRLLSRAASMTKFKLTQNCRNLPRIGYQVNLLSHLQPGYQRFRRQDDGIDPVFRRYEAAQDQSNLLVTAIHELKAEGYALSEIVILSPMRDTSTAATTTDPWLRQILKPFTGADTRPGQIRYSTIHAFKGLEAPAIVVTDLDENSVDNFDSLLYIGLTRATDRLIAFMKGNTLRHAIGGTS
jgi:hypothetical protein